MITPRRRLSRRTLLRGTGVALGLPILEAMLTDSGLLPGRSSRAATPMPRRYLEFFFGNGTRIDLWRPPREGRLDASNLSPCLATLAAEPGQTDILPDVTVVGGLDTLMPKTFHGAYTFAMGDYWEDVKYLPAKLPSIDHLIAEAIGQGTRFRTLHFAHEKSFDDNAHYISWKPTGKPGPYKDFVRVDELRDCKQMFDVLFPNQGAPPGSAATREASSLLDHVLGETTRLAARLGAGDRARLDEYLTAVREVERESRVVASCDGGAPDFAAAVNHRDRTRLALRILVLALRCDLTRVFTFTHSHGISMLTYNFIPEIANLTDHDDISHGQVARGSLTKEAFAQLWASKIIAVTRYKVSEFAYLVRLLKDTREGDGTLLDSCLAYCGSEISTGSKHDTVDMPILLAGRLQGRIRTGQHLRYPPGTSRQMMFVAMMQAFGLPLESYGRGGDGPLPGLLG